MNPYEQKTLQQSYVGNVEDKSTIKLVSPKDKKINPEDLKISFIEGKDIIEKINLPFYLKGITRYSVQNIDLEPDESVDIVAWNLTNIMITETNIGNEQGNFTKELEITFDDSTTNVIQFIEYFLWSSHKVITSIKIKNYKNNSKLKIILYK